jgi:hypothetical protein
MTTDDLLALLAARGVRLGWQDGKPCLRGPPGSITPAVLAAFRFHREAVLARFPPPGTPPARRLREWLFRTGEVWFEPPPWKTPAGHVIWDTVEDFDPFGAVWWRYAGETCWRPIPGRVRDGESPPCTTPTATSDVTGGRGTP